MTFHFPLAQCDPGRAFEINLHEICFEIISPHIKSRRNDLCDDDVS